MKKLSISLLLISLSCSNFLHTSDEKLTESQERQILYYIQEINATKIDELLIPTFSETEPEHSPTYRKKMNSQQQRELAALKTRIAKDRTKQTNRELLATSIFLKVQQNPTPSFMPGKSTKTREFPASPSSFSPNQKISPKKPAWR